MLQNYLSFSWSVWILQGVKIWQEIQVARACTFFFFFFLCWCVTARWWCLLPNKFNYHKLITTQLNLWVTGHLAGHTDGFMTQ